MSNDKKFIYVIYDTGRDRIKIGRSSNPEARLKTLQTSNSDELILQMKKERIHSKKFETWLHRQFAQNRKRGEWFEGVTAEEVSSKLMGCLLWDWNDDD